MPNSQLLKHKYLIGLHSFLKFGPVSLTKILKIFPEAKAAWQASAKELMAAGLKENIAQEFTAFRRQINLDDLLAKISQENISLVTIKDKEYPPLLKQINDPPPLLFYRGQLNQNADQYALAVVGARKYSPYGKIMAEKIVSELAANGLVIVSGLALGIDSLSHRAALSAAGRTIAVLGSGLDKESIYPAANRRLAEEIASAGGAVLSEFPLQTPPLKHHFPQRNRLIAGLARGTLVIEAGEKSGSLITAQLSLDYNREVFAVPGNATSPTASGTNWLLKQGAAVATTAADILQALDLQAINNYIKTKTIMPETKTEEKLCRLLAEQSRHINELIRLSGLKAPEVASALAIMEMKGLVKHLGGMEYMKI